MKFGSFRSAAEPESKVAKNAHRGNLLPQWAICVSFNSGQVDSANYSRVVAMC